MNWKVWVAICLSISLAPAQSREKREDVQISASIASIKYCQGRFTPFGREEDSDLTLKIVVTVTYHNGSSTPLIVPLFHSSAIATQDGRVLSEMILPPSALPVYGQLTKAHIASPSPPYAVLILPGGSAESPYLNDVFTIPIDRANPEEESVDLGSHWVFDLKRNHMVLTKDVIEEYKSAWGADGELWTGTAVSNQVTLDVPFDPDISNCIEDYKF